MKNIVLAYAWCEKLHMITPDDANRLTHVNIAFGLVNEDCTLNRKNLGNIRYIDENDSTFIIMSSFFVFSAHVCFYLIS